MKIKSAIVGASGYAGAQLLALLNSHPHVDSVRLGVQSKPGVPVSELFQGFYQTVPTYTETVDEIMGSLETLDILFLALPHGVSMELLSKYELPDHLGIIDLGADFRLRSAEEFQYWYNMPHAMKSHLSDWVYGLPEFNRKEIKASKRVANPGCYPTASLIALIPALMNNLIDPDSIIIDAKSGISGAGRGLSLNSLYCESADSIKAYGVAGHRHTAEIEQAVRLISNPNVNLTFTPHLIPMKRGILSTVYGKLKKDVSIDAVLDIYTTHYKDEPFVRVRQELPETRWVACSNFCDVSVRIDSRTNRLIMISAIDNLMKGAASQALQNMNILSGLEETEGMPVNPIIP